MNVFSSLEKGGLFTQRGILGGVYLFVLLSLVFVFIQEFFLNI